MATLTVYPESGDGTIENNGDPSNDWNSTRTQSSGDRLVYDSINSLVAAGFVNNEYYEIDRAFLPFDTSSLPNDATITDATLSIYVNTINNADGERRLALVTTTQASTSSLSLSDYSQVGSTRQATDLALSSLILNSYNTFTLNSTGIANISLTGYTKFGIRMDNDIDGGTPGGYNYVYFSFSEEVGTSRDPKLVITYTENTTTSTTTSTSTTSTSSSTTKTDTTTTTSTSSTSTSSTSSSTSSTSSSTSSTSTSTSSTSSSTTSTSSSTTMPFSLAVDNV